MANYLQLKKDYNNTKSLIKKILSNKDTQSKLTSDGTRLLTYLIDKTHSKLTSYPIIDNPLFSHIYFNNSLLQKDLKLTDQQVQNSIKKLQSYNLINIHTIKGGYTQISSKFFTLNFKNFKFII